MENKKVYAGIDVGSTTIKLVVIDEWNQVLFKRYERHYSDIKESARRLVGFASDLFHDNPLHIKMTGSGGIGIAEALNIDFIQEVIACSKTVEHMIPETDVAIELGGEDAKITFFGASMEQRMNGSCAGGTGAFIDQMAMLLKTDAEGLNELAKGHKKLYPIASRCGVFAKTDVQPLINDGVAREDIAASIFQAVVNQTIAGLASGRKIKGKVAFLGGPLTFLSELRQRFIETLKVQEQDIIFPEDPQLFVAMGAAYDARETQATTFRELLEHLSNGKALDLNPSIRLNSLFKSEEELLAFRKRHGQAKIEEQPLKYYKGIAFLGIDAGSTTTKVTLINPEGEVLWKYYDSNDGDPLNKTISIMKELYKEMPRDVFIGRSVTTGYGEALIKNALKVDQGEVETICHYKAAERFQPGVDFILDIGGQDMKAMTVKDGVLSSIKLNEACSSGCGSFIETLAKSLNYNVYDFADAALESRAPVDLGSRCTVFMNSKVRQMQKEGASVADLSAGLSLSVIKNALFKVIKVKDPKHLGDKIVCQGGTFNNESVLRAFETISGREVVRPNLAGLMGAYGCALIALENYTEAEHSTLLSLNELEEFTAEKKFTRCTLCADKCALTMTIFKDGRRFVTGNRCEKGADMHLKGREKKERINLYEYKYKRLFEYKTLNKKDAPRGVVGIPRVLNMYEDYPLWATFFNRLGFSVQLSGRSNQKLYEDGIDTIPDDTVCYPAKLVHGHIKQLIRKKADLIFFPCINYQQQEERTAVNSYNCPIVVSYPDLISVNVDEIREGQVDYRHPHLNLLNDNHVIDTLYETFKDKGILRDEIRDAYLLGLSELESFKGDMKNKGEEALHYMKAHNEQGIVLSGRPYHVDPEVNHGVANVINEEGFHVLTEDSVFHLQEVGELRVVNQWSYHSRLYAAARVVTKFPNIEMVQLNSFGCGLDAVTTEQVQDILEQYGKIHTVLKIDETSNLGAIRIRIRSLKAAMKERNLQHVRPLKKYDLPESITFTKEMKEKHTLLLPMMSPIHQSGLIDEAFISSGYNVVQISEETGAEGVDEGLKYVNNDACFPAIITIGQIVDALRSGKYDLNHTSVMLTQTGGGCRATNYIPLLKKALNDAGFPDIPVVSISVGNKGTQKQDGFKLTLPLIMRISIGSLYGDLFQKVVYRTRPYEAVKGTVDALHQKWIRKVRSNVHNGSVREFNKNMKQIIRDFDAVEIIDTDKPKVGIVGEILVKYSPTANNDVVRLLEKEGSEVVVPDLVGFMNYNLYTMQYKSDELGFSKWNKSISQFLIKLIQLAEKPMNQALKESERFTPFHSIYDIAEGAQAITSIGNHTGEGWYLTGEVVQFLENGVPNILIMQPFGCLPNHIVGKGMMKELRRQYPYSNITAVDYDPGLSIVNQLNRIRLMLAGAK
ncbi:MAG: 2-hydroxyacyl-CoA dehydratase [Alkalibacterium sp.]|nr:2-hydroxyacyl-CoA dehydratase [Alkalibacterium sp.]